MTTIAALDRFTRAYLDTALWSSIDEQPGSRDLYVGDDGRLYFSPSEP